MLELLFVGTGGFLGCCFRFCLTRLIPSTTGFPAATLLSNVIAGFLIGFFTGLEKSAGWMTPRVKLFLTTGMLGGLSTFSTFSLETLRLLSDANYLYAFGNIILNLTLSFSGVALGVVAARLITGKSM
ncbi:MAG: CrcB family protein [Clostridiaceae bacterium]|nr:CrcB family protein [Clostridiaceae bacterium]